MEESLCREVAPSVRWSEGVLAVFRAMATPAWSLGGKRMRTTASLPGISESAASARALPVALAAEPGHLERRSHTLEAVSDDMLRRLQRLRRSLELVLERTSHAGELPLAADPMSWFSVRVIEEL